MPLPLPASYWTLPIITVLASCFLAPLIMKIFGLGGKNHFDVNGQTVLLTGGSDGLGKSAAKILARKGAHIVIVARNVEKLRNAIAEIQACASQPKSQRFHYISADVSLPHEATRIVDETTHWNSGQPPDIVWCVAGAALPTLFLDSSPAQLRAQMDLNYWSSADMAHAILTHWLRPHAPAPAAAPRHLILTSSSLAFFAIAGYSPYAPAKAALRSLADALAQEVLLYAAPAARGPVVRVHAVFPGSILTAGFAHENRSKPAITKILEADDPRQTPDVVAEKSIRGLERGEFLITTNWLAYAMRACAWGGSRRNHWLLDTLAMGVSNLAWPLVQRDLNGKIVRFGRERGHPSTYATQAVPAAAEAR